MKKIVAKKKPKEGSKAEEKGESKAVEAKEIKAGKGDAKTGKIKTTGKTDGKSNKLGGGGRFKQVEAKAKAEGADDPAAVAAAVGRKKYGKAKMSNMAVAGKKRGKK